MIISNIHECGVSAITKIQENNTFDSLKKATEKFFEHPTVIKSYHPSKIANTLLHSITGQRY